MKWFFYVSNVVAALLLATLLLFILPWGQGKQWLKVWISHWAVSAEIAFLLLSVLVLALKKPRIALLFQSLAIFWALLEIGGLVRTLVVTGTLSPETLAATLFVVGLPVLLPPVLSLFLLLGSVKRMEQVPA